MKYRAWCIVGSLGWLGFVACGGSEEPSSGGSDGCKSNSECRNGRVCVAGECVARDASASGGSAGKGGSGTGGGSGAGATGGVSTGGASAGGSSGVGASSGTGGSAGVPGDASAGSGGNLGAAGSAGAAGAAGGSGMAGQGGAAGAPDAGNAGAAGTAGAGGSGGQPPLGDPITGLTPGKWQWVPIAGARCRDGSATGIGANLSASSSTRVMIYLEGGGACFNGTTCLANPGSFGQANFGAGPGAGIFTRTNAANPVRDWNYFYIPYCTGDVHSGNNPGANVPGGPANQQFVGRLNMEAYLRRIVPTVNATQVLLTGVSAGGFGAASNYDLASRYYGSVPVLLLDDSGPPMSSQYIPACLQTQWRTIWGLDRSILADCGSACPNQNDFILDFTMFLLNKYSNRAGGLVSSLQDSTIRTFYGYGLNNCNAGLLPSMPAATFQAGLEDYRTRIQGKNFGTYYITGSSHTWIGGAGFFNTNVQNTTLASWVGALINGTTSHVAP